MSAADLSIGSRLDWTNYFYKIYNSVDRNLRKNCGANITQARILLYLATHETTPIGAVGKNLALKPSTITASVNRIVNDGYINRSLDELDRRLVHISITEDGLGAVPAYLLAFRKAFEEDCPAALKKKRNTLRKLLLPASSQIFFGEQTSLEDATERVAKAINLDADREEMLEHVTRVLIVESVSHYLAKLAEFDSRHDLSLNEARMLRVLGNDNKGMRIKEVSSYLNIRPNVASLSVGTLSDRGLINRAVLLEDRRSTNLKLTRKGARLVRDTRDELCEIFDSCFPTGLCEREVSEFFAV